MKTKREHRFFIISEFVEEQNYLMRMHKNGWKFRHYSILKGYLFEECNKEEWIYELDYKTNVDDLDTYLQLFQDCGWEYVFEFNNFYYFRKQKTEEDLDTSIFSDDQSRYALCKKLLTPLGSGLIFLSFFLMVILLPNFYQHYEYNMENNDMEYFIVQITLIILYIVLIVIFIGAIAKIFSIMKKFNVQKNE